MSEVTLIGAVYSAAIKGNGIEISYLNRRPDGLFVRAKRYMRWAIRYMKGKPVVSVIFPMHEGTTRPQFPIFTPRGTEISHEIAGAIGQLLVRLAGDELQVPKDAGLVCEPFGCRYCKPLRRPDTYLGDVDAEVGSRPVAELRDKGDYTQRFVCEVTGEDPLFVVGLKRNRDYRSNIRRRISIGTASVETGEWCSFGRTTPGPLPCSFEQRDDGIYACDIPGGELNIRVDDKVLSYFLAEML